MTTCPICGANIKEAVSVCPKCHARISPPAENARQPLLKSETNNSWDKIPRGPISGKSSEQPAAGTPEPPGPQENRRQDVPPAAPEMEVPPGTQENRRQNFPLPPPETAAPGPETVRESPAEPGNAVPGYPGGATPPPGSPYGYPYGSPYGYYMPFQTGPYAGQGAGAEDTQAIATRQVPPQGYQMPFPFLPGWPYPPLMVLPATCYPYAMQQGMYPGYCYPGMGGQYPPAAAGYPPRYYPGGQPYDTPRRKKTGAVAIILIVIVVLLLLAGAGVGVYLYLMPGSPSFDLGSSSVPGEDIELKNMRLDQKDGQAVLTGTYENQGSREGEVIVTITGVSNGTDTVLSFNVPVNAEATDSFTLSEPAQADLSTATLGPLLFKRSSSSSDDYNNGDSDSSSYPWQDDGSSSDQYNDSSGTVPGDSTIIEEESVNVSPQTSP